MKTRVLQALKTKAASLGFNKDELEGAIDVIITLGNLKNSEEEASSDEDINLAIDKVMPLLTLAQKQANRVISKSKTQQPKVEPTQPTNEPNDLNQPTDVVAQITKMFEDYKKEQDAKFAKLEGERVATTRKSQVEAILKESGVFGERVMRNFSRMTFKDEDEFSAFIEETKADLEAYNKERAEAGLATIGPIGKPTSTEPKKEVISDDEVQAIARSF